MIHEVVANSDLEFQIKSGGEFAPHQISADDLWFDLRDEDWSKKHSRIFEWSSNVDQNAVVPNIRISVHEAQVAGLIDYINITLRDCELGKFPSLSIEEVDSRTDKHSVHAGSGASVFRRRLMDDETRKRFDSIDGKFDAVFSRLDAIVTRLDEQDASHDRLMGKVDRLGVLARAGEEAMTSLDALSRRVAKLEAARRGTEE